VKGRTEMRGGIETSLLANLALLRCFSQSEKETGEAGSSTGDSASSAGEGFSLLSEVTSARIVDLLYSADGVYGGTRMTEVLLKTGNGGLFPNGPRVSLGVLLLTSISAPPPVGRYLISSLTPT
jgi:hypothetical protein